MEQQRFNLCDPAVDVNPERRRLSKQCAAILARLQEGPATNAELATLSLKYTSRISDLRKSGYTVTVSQQNRSTGRAEYRLG